MKKAWLAVGGVVALVGCATQSGQMDPKQMTFFVTSANPGKGGDFGGLEGADAYCTSLARSAGAPADRVWRAYLSTQGKALNDPNVVHARDRIGSGPWHNAKGVRIARDVDDLHSPSNNINKGTVMDEKGQPVNDRTMKPSRHDILTGSRPDGTAFPGGHPMAADMTCGNWTKGGPEGSAMTGHFDRAGPVNHPWATSWNSAHPTLGCSLERIRPTGGEGLLYCFAAK